MDIRRLMLLLPLSFSMLLHSAEPDKEWEDFVKQHDMYLLVKHVHKNVDRWVKFALSALPDDPHQATWIERADFLSDEEKPEIDKLFESKNKYQGTVYEQIVGGESKEDRFVMLMVGIFEPKEQTYRFVMDPCYHCVSAMVVKKPEQKKEKFAELYQKITSLMSETWSSIVE